MAGDLERFLQQAAERLAEKVNEAQGGRKPARKAPRPPQNVRRAERAPVDPQILDAEIIEADVIPDDVLRRRGPDPLSYIDTRPELTQNTSTRRLAQNISQADERMADRVHDALDHDLVNLRDASKALGRDRSQPSTEGAGQIERRDQAVSPLIKMLRDPETLRSAFIASEIFRRKF